MAEYTRPMDGIAALLREAISIPSVSGDERELRAFQRWITERFPALFAGAEVRTPDPYRVIIRIGGARSDRPVLLAAHYDVVPAPTERWTVDPFGGVVRDGAVWGRGALDDKVSVVALLAAAEGVVRAGFRPSQDVYIALGGDEEVGGARGAGATAADLAAAGVRLATVLDEGSAVTRGLVPGTSRPVALVGVAEKGHLTVRISARSGGGHASAPPHPDPAAAFSDALRRVTRRPFPVRRTEATTAFLRGIGRVAGGITGAALRAYPVTAPAVHRILGAQAGGAAMLRTTAALTRLSAAEADNVIPAAYRAACNIRILPDETIASTLDRLRAILPPSVQIDGYDPADANDPPPQSPAGGAGWDRVRTAIGAVWPDVPVVPSVVTATTDSRHFVPVAETIYRFAPYTVDAELLATIHGADERVPIDQIAHAVAFYAAWITEGGLAWPTA